MVRKRWNRVGVSKEGEEERGQGFDIGMESARQSRGQDRAE
jgi:hypothetical protein